jgi:hypothetical protein
MFVACDVYNTQPELQSGLQLHTSVLPCAACLVWLQCVLVLTAPFVICLTICLRLFSLHPFLLPLALLCMYTVVSL